MIALAVLPMLRDAANGRYFAALPLPQYGVFGVSLAWNATSIALLLGSLNRRDPSYREYLAFRRAGGARTPIAGLTPHGIQQRLALTYIPLILVVIVVLSWVLMRDYSRTLLEAVIDGGLSLAVRTAGTVKANADDLIAVEDVLDGEAVRNRGAHLPFRAISLYWKAPRGASISVAVSTDAARRGTTVAAGDEPSATGYRLLDDGSRYEFRSPVTLGGKSLGWVGVEYARDVIYEPMFRTQVKVTLIAALFVYAAVFLTWVFGQAVVFPILYLRMSVASIASALGSMIAGRSRVSPDLLQYRDLVTTRDEIRSLSGEIGNMTTVIRGVLPYISTSTLQHAGQEKAEGAAEAALSDLALLFTDIRNFTAFSEGKSPGAVISALNRCHEVQATAILEQHGDIDNVVGDGMFARFDGPEKELNACRAAFAIRAAMAEERRRAAGSGEPGVRGRHRHQRGAGRDRSRRRPGTAALHGGRRPGQPRLATRGCEQGLRHLVAGDGLGRPRRRPRVPPPRDRPGGRQGDAATRAHPRAPGAEGEGERAGRRAGAGLRAGPRGVPGATLGRGGERLSRSSWRTTRIRRAGCFSPASGSSVRGRRRRIGTAFPS